MNDQPSRSLTLIEKIAAASSVAIILSAAIFWIIQIRGVMETLETAYG